MMERLLYCWFVGGLFLIVVGLAAVLVAWLKGYDLSEIIGD